MLTFAWKIRDRSMLHLAAAFILLAGLMTVFFLVFRITYPSMQRASATPRHIMVLDPADPAARIIIHRAQDKSFALFPTEDGLLSSSPPFPAFQPSFNGAKMRLLPMPEAPVAARMPRIFTPATPVLPAVPPRATLPSGQPPAVMLRAIPGAEIAKRAQGQMSLPALPVADPHSIQFRVAIGAAGQVLVALPLHPVDDPALMRQLQAAVAALRFTADPKTARQWGTLGFRWESASASGNNPRTDR